MGRNIKRCFLFIDDLEGLESLFTDMSAKGWELKSFRNLATFEKRDATEYNRYRLDVFNACDQAGKDRIAFYEEAGWTHVATIGVDFIQAFRAPRDTAIPELHTDPAELAKNIETLKKRIARRSLWMSLLYAGMFLIQLLLIFINRTSFFTGSSSLITNLSFLFILIYFGIISARKVRGLRRLIDSMKNGRPFNHNFDYKKSVEKARAIIIAPLIMSAILLAFGIYDMIDLIQFNPPVPAGSLLVLSFADIPPYQNQIKSVLDSGNNSTWDNFYKLDWSPLLPRQYTLFEAIPLPGDSSAFIISERYQALAPVVAQAFFQALLDENGKRLHPKDDILSQIPSDFFDELWILKYSENDFKLIAKRGSNIYFFEFIGPAKSEEIPTLDQFIRLLEEKAR